MIVQWHGPRVWLVVSLHAFNPVSSFLPVESGSCEDPLDPMQYCSIRQPRPLALVRHSMHDMDASRVRRDMGEVDTMSFGMDTMPSCLAVTQLQPHIWQVV